jgi:hypothetical protein
MRREATMVLREEWVGGWELAVDTRHTGFFVFAFYSGQQTYLASDNFTIVQIIPATTCYNRYSVSHKHRFSTRTSSGAAASRLLTKSPFRRRRCQCHRGSSAGW